jgi:hypothetical protein
VTSKWKTEETRERSHLVHEFHMISTRLKSGLHSERSANDHLRYATDQCKDIYMLNKLVNNVVTNLLLLR